MNTNKNTIAKAQSLVKKLGETTPTYYEYKFKLITCNNAFAYIAVINALKEVEFVLNYCLSAKYLYIVNETKGIRISAKLLAMFENAVKELQ